MSRFKKGTSKYYKWSDEITKLTKEGYTGTDISIMLGIDKSQVNKLRKYLGLPNVRNNKFTPDNPEFEEKLKNKGYVLISRERKGTQKHPKYEVKCSNCGEISLKSGNLITKSRCKCSKLNKQPSNFKGFQLISSAHFNSIKSGASKRKILFNITIEEIWQKFEEQDRKCALSGLELNMSTNFTKRSLRNASLDRIDSKKGYILENIQWIHKDINRMKNSYSEEYFIEMCKLIIKHKTNINE